MVTTLTQPKTARPSLKMFQMLKVVLTGYKPNMVPKECVNFVVISSTRTCCSVKNCPKNRAFVKL